MTNAFTWGFDGWIYACHGFSNESTVEGVGQAADHDAVGQRLPDAARRLAPRVLHARAGQPVRPGVRPARQPLLVRLPQPADLPAPPRGLLPELRQARRRPRLRPRDDRPRPRLDRRSRDRLLRGRPLPRGVPRHDLHRQRRHQPDQPRPARVARLDPEGDRAARLPRQRRPLVPPGRHRARPRRRPLRRRLLQPDHRPLRGPARPTPAATASAGRIWRIVYKGKDGKARPEGRPGADWSAATVDELVEDLGHPNLAVRTLAANQLVGARRRPRSRPVDAAVADATRARWRRVHALWVLAAARARSTTDRSTGAARRRRPAVRVHAHADPGRAARRSTAAAAELARDGPEGRRRPRPPGRRRGARPAPRRRQHPPAAGPPGRRPRPTTRT